MSASPGLTLLCLVLPFLEAIASLGPGFSLTHTLTCSLRPLLFSVFFNTDFCFLTLDFGSFFYF